MRILVTYASKYGATMGIAERITERLTTAGLDTAARPIDAVDDLTVYDAVVVGSAVYLGHWLKDARRFVRKNAEDLAARPVWLFSSGPLGTETTDDEGGDVRTAAEPKELGELQETLDPKDHRVFFGALDPAKLRMRDRLIRATPAGRNLLPEGDFRDWDEIEAWADGIARELARPARHTG